MNAATIIAFCVSCDKPRYRSVRPLDAKKDHISPDLFQPVEPDVPPAPKSGPAQCHICKRQLRFLPEESVPTLHAPAPKAPPPPLPERPLRSSLDGAAGPQVSVLFETNPDEQMLNVLPGRDGSLLVVTSHRIVTVRA